MLPKGSECQGTAAYPPGSCYVLCLTLRAASKILPRVGGGFGGSGGGGGQSAEARRCISSFLWAAVQELRASEAYTRALDIPLTRLIRLAASDFRGPRS